MAKNLHYLFIFKGPLFLPVQQFMFDHDKGFPLLFIFVAGTGMWIHLVLTFTKLISVFPTSLQITVSRELDKDGIC